LEDWSNRLEYIFEILCWLGTSPIGVVENWWWWFWNGTKWAGGLKSDEKVLIRIGLADSSGRLSRLGISNCEVLSKQLRFLKWIVCSWILGFVNVADESGWRYVVSCHNCSNSDEY
jgi:hypothetical protein